MSGFIPLLGVWLLRSTAFAQDLKIPTTGPTESNPSKVHGLEFGVRSGYGFNILSTEGYGDPSDFYRVSKLIPLWADLGYRIHPNWYVGAFFQYGIGQGFEGCKYFSTPPNCSGNNLRFGVNAHYHFTPNRKLDPWAGIGAGYEIAHSKFTFPQGTVSAEFQGFEFLNLQLGLDYRVARAVGIGPFVAFTMAQYSNEFAKTTGYDKLHGWLILGIRAAFDLIPD
jgi:hypothetical protein